MCFMREFPSVAVGIIEARIADHGGKLGGLCARQVRRANVKIVFTGRFRQIYPLPTQLYSNRFLESGVYA